MNYSPIILFCYRRLDTLKRCISSLQNCPESKLSDLVIISDMFAKESDAQKVNDVRQFLPSITGFKSIEIIKREKNLGVDFNIITCLKEMAIRFNQFIIVEDDLVVAKDFLRFLNYSLDFYANNTEIVSVTGFSFMNKIPGDYKYDAFFAKRMCPWGWATWSDKIKGVDWEIKDKDSFMQSKETQNHYNEWGSDRSRMLIHTIKGKTKAWDCRLDYYQFKHGYCTLYPIYTLVENIGFGNEDASNTFGYNRYKTKLKLKLGKNLRLPESIFFDQSIVKRFIEKYSVLQRIHTRLMKLIGYKN